MVRRQDKFGDRGGEDAATVITALKEKPKFATLCIYSLNCLGKLARTRNNVDHIIENDGVDAIINTMERHNTSSRVIKEGTTPLILACKVPEYAKKIGQEGGIGFCLKQLDRSDDSNSNIHTTKLLEALCDGDPSNIDLLKNDPNALNILDKTLKQGLDSKNKKLTSSVLKLLDILTKDADTCKNLNPSIVDNIVKAIEVYPADNEISLYAIKVLINLAKNGGDEIIAKLREAGIVDLISKAMDSNSTNKDILKYGTEALYMFSDKSDLDNALSEFDKTKGIIEKKNAIAMIGNLSMLKSNVGQITNSNILDKLLKIIKSLISKANSLSDSEKSLLNSSLISIARIGICSDSGVNKLEKSLFPLLKKGISNNTKSPDIFTSILVNLDITSDHNKGYISILEDKNLLSLLNIGFEKFDKDENVKKASFHLLKKLAKSSKGVQKLSKLNFIKFICDTINNNIKNEMLVDGGLDALIAISEYASELSKDDIKNIISSALKVLTENKDNVKLCKKSLTLLRLLADKSNYASEILNSYEAMSVLSNFKNETDNAELLEEINKLVETLKSGKKVKGVEELLTEVEKLSKSLEEGKLNQNILEEMYNPSSSLLALIETLGEKEKLLAVNGIPRLKQILTLLSKTQPSEIRDEIINNILNMIAEIVKENNRAIEITNISLLNTILDLYSYPQFKQPIENIMNNYNISKETALYDLEQIYNANIHDTQLIQSFHDLSILCDAIYNNLPYELETEISVFVKNSLTIACNIIETCDESDEKLKLSALAYVDLMIKNKNIREYYIDNHLSTLVSIIKRDPDNEVMCGAIFNSMEGIQDNNEIVMVKDIKKWYYGRLLETDLESLKMHLLDSVYETMDDPSKINEYQQNLQKLTHCYSQDNEKVDLSENYTNADHEIIKFIDYIMASKSSIDHKKGVVKLMNAMMYNPKILALFIDQNYFSNICRSVKMLSDPSEKMLLVNALIPLMLLNNDEISKSIKDCMNDAILSISKINMENDRNNILDMIVDTFKDSNGKTIITAECLEALLRLLDMQKNDIGKAKVVNLIATMVNSSEQIAMLVANGEGLIKVLKYLDQFKNSVVYADAATLFTKNLAEMQGTIPKLEEYNVDKIMTDLMFSYNNEMNIFHQAQRTKDLMNLAKYNFTPEELAAWKAKSRSRHLMTEFCRGLGIMISYILTKSERELKTGDTAKDISDEVARSLHEFPSSVDSAIESDVSTTMLSCLATGWLLRAYLMTYTFVVEKEISARGYNNAPKTIEDTLINTCGFYALWDFENQDYDDKNLCVRGGIGHQSVKAIFDSSLMDPQKCQEMNTVTGEYFGREFTLKDLIVMARMDEDERNMLKSFNLILAWVRLNWNRVTITASMCAKKLKGGSYSVNNVFIDGEFLSLRCGLDWNWSKEVNQETFYFVKPNANYNTIGIIKKPDENKKGLHIKVGLSGKKLREKRKEIKDTLDLTSNVLRGKEKDDFNFFTEIAKTGMSCTKIERQLLKNKLTETYIKMCQEDDGNMYFSWGPKLVDISKRGKFNMKEIENVFSGKETKSFAKVSDKKAPKENCMTILGAGGREANFCLESPSNRDTWAHGMKLALCTVVGRPTSEMKWE